LALAQTQRKERRADNGKEVAFGAEWVQQTSRTEEWIDVDVVRGMHEERTFDIPLISILCCCWQVRPPIPIATGKLPIQSKMPAESTPCSACRTLPFKS
jgi:hypothetical protein